MRKTYAKAIVDASKERVLVVVLPGVAMNSSGKVFAAGIKKLLSYPFNSRCLRFSVVNLGLLNLMHKKLQSKNYYSVKIKQKRWLFKGGYGSDLTTWNW